MLFLLNNNMNLQMTVGTIKCLNVYTSVGKTIIPKQDITKSYLIKS